METPTSVQSPKVRKVGRQVRSDPRAPPPASFSKDFDPINTVRDHPGRPPQANLLPAPTPTGLPRRRNRHDGKTGTYGI